jgi:hypothetical protein
MVVPRLRSREDHVVEESKKLLTFSDATRTHYLTSKAIEMFVGIWPFQGATRITGLFNHTCLLRGIGRLTTHSIESL